MKRMAEFISRVLLTTLVCIVPLVARGENPDSSLVPKEATAFAMQYLRSVESSTALPVDNSSSKDFIFVGKSSKPVGGWRIIAIGGNDKLRIVWDSFSLHDSYFDVIGLSFINTRVDEHNGYIVTLRGCVPHQCADGKIGFAIYASREHQTYISHVSTQEDDSYRVTYFPKSGMPDAYRKELDQMMCSDNGISRPSSLPIKCAAQ